MSNDDKLFDLMSKMYSETTTKMDKMYSEMNTKMDKMYSEMQLGFNRVDERFNKVEARLDKLELLQENTNKKLQTLAEVQQSFQEQLGRNKTDNASTLGQQIDVIELAVTNTSSSVNEIKNRVEVLDEKIDILQVDVNHLASKTAQSDNKIIELSRNVSKFKY